MNWTKEQEKEANTFAFAFLMLEKEVRKVFEEKDGNLKAIAEYFNVSLTTANQRLINLGLKKMASDVVVIYLIENFSANNNKTSIAKILFYIRL